MDVDNLCLHYLHAIFLLVIRVSHLGVWKDGEIIKLDAVVLPALNDLRDTVGKRFIGLVGQAENQVGHGLHTLGAKAALDLMKCLEVNVVALNSLESLLVHRLQGNHNAFIKAGIRKNFLNLVRSLRGVFCILHRYCLRIAALQFNLGTATGNLHIPRQNAKIGVGTKNKFDFVVGEPINFPVDARDIP